jgi:hypothetical protein
MTNACGTTVAAHLHAAAVQLEAARNIGVRHVGPPIASSCKQHVSGGGCCRVKL